jgi:hypothetical protein
MDQTVVVSIVEERERQDAKWGGPDHDDNHSPAEWGSFIREKLVQASKTTSADEYRRRMVQVAALAVAAIESHDRWWAELPGPPSG